MNGENIDHPKRETATQIEQILFDNQTDGPKKISPQSVPDAMPIAGAPGAATGYEGLLQKAPTLPPLEDGSSSAAAETSEPTPVFVIGTIDYDFISETRRDVFVRAYSRWFRQTFPDKNEEPITRHLKAFLNDRPWQHDALTWTVNIDDTPVYAVLPAGPYADDAYRELLDDHLSAGWAGEHQRECAAIAGWVIGKITLRNERVIPVIQPVRRGMECWSTEQILDEIYGKKDPKRETQRENMHNFLKRVYYELRNLGLEPPERAINFAATHAFITRTSRLPSICKETGELGLVLDTIHVAPSPIKRPDSDCWDVEIKFFNPADQLNKARRRYCFTVDVNDVTPVVIGEDQSWYTSD